MNEDNLSFMDTISEVLEFMEGMDERMIEDSLDHGEIEGIQWCIKRAPLYNAVNGYVKLPKGHRLWDERFHNDLDVNGGITYGPSADGWIGFDTLHMGDVWPDMPERLKEHGGRFWNEELVADEARYLARQVAELN